MNSRFLLIAALAVSACTYGNTVAYDSQPRPKKAPDAVQVLDMHDVTRPYRVIGAVSADSYYQSSALKSCRKQAGELGADAIIGFGPNGNQTGGGGLFATGGGLTGMYGSYNTGFSGKAIVWQ